MTVYKAIKKEANAAAALAIAIVKGQKARPGVNGKTFDGKKNVPSVLLTPVAITKKNYKLLFSDGFLKKSDVCVGQYAKYCK
jgi:D-xylose transport system substrate-binding protein